VGEITKMVNRNLAGRGEKLQYGPEKVGLRLRKAGLLDRRLGAERS
jgi:hypothetical protein